MPGAGVEACREHHHLHHAEAGDDEAQEVVVAFAPLFVVFFVRGVQVRGVAEAGDGGEDGGERGVAPADFGAAGAEVDAGVVECRARRCRAWLMSQVQAAQCRLSM